jgi:3-dehydrosphinganine reductase
MPVVITGAGSGIGLRLAELLATRGEAIVALDLAFPRIAREALLAAVGGAEERLVTFEVDVRNGERVRAAIVEGVATLGTPSLVLNCAGILDAREFTEISEADFRRVIDTNLIGSRNVAAAAVEVLGPGGRLVLTASLAGLVTNYGYSSYSASKFGVIALADVLRMELRPRGIAVSVITPPEVETPMLVEERRSAPAATTRMKQLAGSLPLDPAAEAILAGIDRGEFLIIPSRRAKMTALLPRVLPRRLTHAIVDLVIRRERRRA